MRISEVQERRLDWFDLSTACDTDLANRLDDSVESLGDTPLAQEDGCVLVGRTRIMALQQLQDNGGLMVKVRIVSA